MAITMPAEQETYRSNFK